MLIKPLSPRGSTSGTTNKGSGRRFPFSYTRTRPGRSVKSIRPSGVQTIDQTTSRFGITVSTLKLDCVSCDDSTSPAPRPGGGWLHAMATNEIKKSHAKMFDFISEVRRLIFTKFSIFHLTFFIDHWQVWKPHPTTWANDKRQIISRPTPASCPSSLANVIMQQLQFN